MSSGLSHLETKTTHFTITDNRKGALQTGGV